MAVYTKEFLTGTGDGTGLKVSATSAGGAVTVHTVPAGVKDELWIYAANDDAASSVTLTVLFGGTDNPDDYVHVSLASRRGLVAVVPGLVLGAGLVVKAYASSGDKILIHGFVNRIT